MASGNDIGKLERCFSLSAKIKSQNTSFLAASQPPGNLALFAQYNYTLCLNCKECSLEYSFRKTSLESEIRNQHRQLGEVGLWVLRQL